MARKGMKVLICGINSKYVHVMPAVWFLSEAIREHSVEEMQLNINLPMEQLLYNITQANPDFLLLSVYIFNVATVRQLVSDCKKAMPHCTIVLGGPEIHAESAQIFSQADYFVIGEGEGVINAILQGNAPDRVIYAPTIVPLDSVASPYTKERIQRYSDRILYYESSRGCPFHCGYCLASLSEGVRYFSLQRVYADLLNLKGSGVQVVKFTDRTFNANEKRASAIIRFIVENFQTEHITFHFEMAGDIMSSEFVELLCSLPHALFQLEIGVQTLTPDVLKRIHRIFRPEKFLENVRRLIAAGNMHIHLDLIAGLPGETMDSFVASLNAVMQLQPHQMQLGFLKVLKGTAVEKEVCAYSDYPPYEIISTPTCTHAQLNHLKEIEIVIDKLYNSQKYSRFLQALQTYFTSPYAMYADLAKRFLEIHCLWESISDFARIAALYSIGVQFMSEEKVRSILLYDYAMTNNSKVLPPVLKQEMPQWVQPIYRQYKPEKNKTYAYFSFHPTQERSGNFIFIFDYTQKNTVDGKYRLLQELELAETN